MAADNLKRIKIEILGEEYTVKTDESTEHVKELAAYVNDLLQSITKRNIHIGSTKTAILGCLILADDVLRLTAALEKEKSRRLVRKTTAPGKIGNQ